MKFITVSDALYGEIMRWRRASKCDRMDVIEELDALDAPTFTSARVILRVLADEDLSGLRAEDVVPAIRHVLGEVERPMGDLHRMRALEIWRELPEAWKKVAGERA